MTPQTPHDIFLELCQKHHISLRYWNAADHEDISLYLELGTFEHEQQALQYIKDNFEERK